MPEVTGGGGGRLLKKRAHQEVEENAIPKRVLNGV